MFLCSHPATQGVTCNKRPDYAWKSTSKYSRSTVPFGSSNPMWQGPTNVPRTEPLSGVGSLTLRLPFESPWIRSVEKDRRWDSQTPCIAAEYSLESVVDWDILRLLWTFVVTCMGVMLRLLKSGVFGGGSPWLFGDVWLSWSPTNMNSTNRWSSSLLLQTRDHFAYLISSAHPMSGELLLPMFLFFVQISNDSHSSS